MTIANDVDVRRTRYAIGVDVGGTKIAAGVVDLCTGAVVGLAQIATPSAGGGAVLAAVHELVLSRLEVSSQRVVAIGVGTAGVVVDSAIVSANDLIPGWLGQPLARSLSELSGLPVMVRNDVHASALAEARLGAAATVGSALVVAVGTGIGGAVVRGGAVYEGTHGTAGSLGHAPAPLLEGIEPARLCACGARGHVEAYAGGRAIADRWNERTGDHADVRMLGHRVHEVAVRAHIVEAGRLLGQAIAGAVALLDVERIVLGGGVTRLGELYLGGLRAGISEVAMRSDLVPEVVPAAFAAESVLIGAALGSVDERSVGGRAVECS